MKAKIGKRTLQRSLEYIRGLGIPSQKVFACKVEQWNPHAMIRQDMFGFADIVWLSMSAVAGDGQIVAVQVVNTHLPEHIEKINQNQAAQAWMECGGGIEVHNWKQRGPRGKKKWELEIIEVGPAK